MERTPCTQVNSAASGFPPSPAGWLIKDKFSMKNKAALCRSVNYVYGFITENAAGRMAEGHREHQGTLLPLLSETEPKHTPMVSLILNNKTNQTVAIPINNKTA